MAVVLASDNQKVEAVGFVTVLDCPQGVGAVPTRGQALTLRYLPKLT